MIEKNSAVGIILAVTAFVVLVPVILQLRAKERKFADVWGHFVFVAGLLCVAAGYGLFADVRQRYLAIGGLIAALFGLFVQHRDKDSEAE